MTRIGGRRFRALAGAALCAALLASAVAGLPAGASPGAGDACNKGFAKRREIAHGRFLDRRWELSFYRGARKAPCLADKWSAYSSHFRFRIDRRHPRLGIVNLAGTTPPAVGQTVYVFEGYAAPRTTRATFTLDGKRDVVRLIRPPARTGLTKDLFIHFVRGRRFDRDARGRIRTFDRDGELLATRVLRRRDFSEPTEPD